MGEYFVLQSNISWRVPPFHHNVYASMVFVWMARNWWHLDTKTSIDHCLHVSCLSSIFNDFLANSIVLGMRSNLSIRTLHTTPHHNHLNCFHLTIGTHLLCLESITHHGFNKIKLHLKPSTRSAWMLTQHWLSTIITSSQFTTMYFTTWIIVFVVMT
jgi:hypothetical protein